MRRLLFIFMIMLSSVAFGQFDDVYYDNNIDQELQYSSNLRRFYQPISVVSFYNYRYVNPFTYNTFDPFYNVNFYISNRPFRGWRSNNLYGQWYPSYTITTYSGWYTNNYSWDFNRFIYGSWYFLYNIPVCQQYNIPQNTNPTYYGPRNSGVAYNTNRNKSTVNTYTNTGYTQNNRNSDDKFNKKTQTSNTTNGRSRTSTYEFNTNSNITRSNNKNSLVDKEALSSPSHRTNSTGINNNNTNPRTRR